MSACFASLEVDLSALRANYHLLKNRHVKQSVAAVVKANAYGLGMETVARTLWQQGCRRFFVATLCEAVELRAALPEADIGVFNGYLAGQEKEYAAHKLTAVLNDPGQAERFSAHGKGPAILHIDTGMTRLGFSETEAVKFFGQKASFPLSLVMSHLACANDPSNPKNAEQLARFKKMLSLFPGVPASFANSSGLFLSDEFHFDLARPGCGLYGITPVAHDNPLANVASLYAPILQVRTLDRDETVGYGATFSANKGSRLAIIGLGYADGYFRMLSNRGLACVAGYKVPIAGRVSMDMIALDISSVPETNLAGSARAEFIGPQQTVNDIAAQCDTIGYEILTRIGRRVVRVYR